MVPPITMPSFKNVRLSMAPPSHVVIMDCINELPDRASRAGSIPKIPWIISPTTSFYMAALPMKAHTRTTAAGCLPPGRIREPNARPELLPKAGVQRTLEAVSSIPGVRRGPPAVPWALAPTTTHRVGLALRGDNLQVGTRHQHGRIPDRLKRCTRTIRSFASRSWSDASSCAKACWRPPSAARQTSSHSCGDR